MAFSAVVSRRSARAAPTKQNVSFGLSAYVHHPEYEIDMITFEKLALCRLNVLRWVEKQRGLNRPLNNKEASADRDHNEKYLDHILKENDLVLPDVDVASHFICRIAFCRTDEHRRWFLQQELALFEARYETASPEEKQQVQFELSGDSGKYETLYKNELVLLGLNGLSPIPSFRMASKIQNEHHFLPYHKVPWIEVPTLVMRREVVVRDGYAFVPNSKFIRILSGKFRQNLSEALASATRSMELITRDVEAYSSYSRVKPIVKNLAQMSTTKYKTTSIAGQIRHSDVAQFAPVHFPACMQNSFEHLDKDRHLKHGARMQFGLFLKGIGLDLRNTHTFFKKMFAPKTSPEKFEKTYAYMWRHQHGQEGNRRSYSPYGCAKIIQSQPNRDDHHGCPYKMFDEANLRQFLRRRGVLDGDIKRILELKKNHHYQIACRTYFEVTHRQVMGRTGRTIEDIESQSSWNHPNQYFDLSFSLHHPEIARRNQELKAQQNQQNGGTTSFPTQATEPMDID